MDGMSVWDIPSSITRCNAIITIFYTPALLECFISLMWDDEYAQINHKDREGVKLQYEMN